MAAKVTASVRLAQPFFYLSRIFYPHAGISSIEILSQNVYSMSIKAWTYGKVRKIIELLILGHKTIVNIRSKGERTDVTKLEQQFHSLSETTVG
jgi:hypothetical protein